MNVFESTISDEVWYRYTISDEDPMLYEDMSNNDMTYDIH